MLNKQGEVIDFKLPRHLHCNQLVIYSFTADALSVYPMYARQDKRSEISSPFLKILAPSMGVLKLDLHSHVIKFLRFDGLPSFSPLESFLQSRYDYLIFPDLGGLIRFNDCNLRCAFELAYFLKRKSAGKVESCLVKEIGLQKKILLYDDMADSCDTLFSAIGLLKGNEIDVLITYYIGSSKRLVELAASVNAVYIYEAFVERMPPNVFSISK